MVLKTIHALSEKRITYRTSRNRRQLLRAWKYLTVLSRTVSVGLGISHLVVQEKGRLGR